MGWCHAFGPQIRDGCDHAMRANTDSCSCEECGASCHGLFPGCARVWAAGPRPVTIARRSSEGASLSPVPVSAASDGAAPARPAPAAPAASEQSELQALRVDIQVLMWKVDQLQQSSAPGDQIVQAARDIRAVATALPQQLQDAEVALETQRQAIGAMSGEIKQKILADIAQLQERLQGEVRRRPGRQGDLPVTVAELDARFEWLVGAMSERFVTLGNELARIERKLADDPGTHGGIGVTKGNVIRSLGRNGHPPVFETGDNGDISPVADEARP